MIDALTKHFSDISPDERFVLQQSSLSCSGLTHPYRGNIHVLVPGAGLGRLAYDIAKLGTLNPANVIPLAPSLIPAQPGFACQGNEFSLFMLLVSSFILNRLPL